MSTERTVISVIIPAFNEEEMIERVLKAALCADDVEVIVVDGGSGDRTIELAAAAGARVLDSPPGRAKQMNRGAHAAGGDVLLFLHADTLLPDDYDISVRMTLDEAEVAAGAFRLEIDGPEFGLRVIECLTNWRSRMLKMPYGDQAVFMKAALFKEVGGFPRLPIMEDFALIRLLKKRGRIEIIDAPVVTSARRWRSLGLLRTTVINQAIIMAWFFGVSPDRIASWYRLTDRPV